MFSVIICSIDSARFAAVKSMYDYVFCGDDWELIRISDAKSLSEGYNRGLAMSKGDKIIFSHDDIDIFSPDMPRRLEQHLANFDIVGVAGTTLLKHPRWYASGPPHIFGQVANPGKQNDIVVNIFGAPYPVIPGIQALDGLFMAARRSVFPNISFDAVTFDGFHHYDVDFSYAAFRAGFRLAVANDICLFHASRGNYDEAWNRSALKFQQKWFGGGPMEPPRSFIWAGVNVPNRLEALEVMTPPYWSTAGDEKTGWR